MDKNKLNRLIAKVEKPARYMGGELNMRIKAEAEFRFALCFPDTYEIGMSHLGSRIIYNILNKRADTYCERVYAPWVDMEEQLRENNEPLFSLETRSPLREFDVIGFSLLYEMCYTNILTVLELSGIPFLASERGEDMPLIAAGGPCVCNPEPVAEIMDVMFFGDGEELVNDFMDVYAECRRRGLNKRDTLIEISKIEGVYVPAFYKAEYDENGNFSRIVKTEPSAPDRITRRIVRNLDAAEFTGDLVVPYMNIVHDRVALEIFRGCTRGCRFCQAGFIYRPIRERKPKTLIDYADRQLGCTGYDEISLFSLSSGDYSEIHATVPEILERYTKNRVSVSLPSLRIDSFLKDDLEKMQSVRKGGLTFAPEAGTQRLRDVINKGVCEEDLLRAVGDAFESGWQGVKLYFMIGLPTETDEDILGIAELARKVSRLFYQMPKDKRGKGLRCTVSASTFVPKPFTPFQWAPMCTKEQFLDKAALTKQAVREQLNQKRIKYNWHEADVSVLEGVFARGDRKVADVILKAYEKGCIYDAWGEYFKYQTWVDCFQECNVDMDFYTTRTRSDEEVFPWDFLDCGVNRAFLLREWKRAAEAVVTPNCKMQCQGCGAARFGGGICFEQRGGDAV